MESEIKKDITSEHRIIKGNDTLKKISAEIFNSLESVLNSYPNLSLLKQVYIYEYSGLRNRQIIKGELLYDILPEPPFRENGCVKVSLFAGYKHSDGGVGYASYNTISIHFLGSYKIGSEIVNELTTKFKSFEEVSAAKDK